MALALKPPLVQPGPLLARHDLLRWLYLGRLTLVTGILAGAIIQWLTARPEVTLVATVVFIVALLFTSASFWYTHLLLREPGENFLYAQVIVDTLLVTGIVHITGGPDSSFAPLYILVISAGALLLPLPGGVLIGALTSMVYFADLVWGYQSVFSWDVGLQIALFTMVALATGLLGDRLRRAGLALGVVESELRQLRLDTSDILANLATGVITLDGDARLAYANPAAEVLLGTELENRLGEPVLDDLEEAAPGLVRVLRGSLRGGHPVAQARTAVRRDGKEVRLGVSTAVLQRQEGAAPSITAILQDVTDVELVEALARRTERLEAVAELSASLAHEIKNPLASIRSAVEQLAKSHLGEEDRITLERLVLSESDRLSRLLSEFLDYSVLRLGNREEVELASLVQDCLTVIRQHPEATGVEIECETSDPPPRIMGDPDLLHRALFNLLLNAAQHAGDGGVVRVVLEDLKTTPRPRGTVIEHAVGIVVRDSGPGLDPDVAPRIFDPFFTTRSSGSGMGLAVVYRAVEAHAGAIFVETAPEGGAQFVIYLPAGTTNRKEP